MENLAEILPNGALAQLVGRSIPTAPRREWKKFLKLEVLEKYGKTLCGDELKKAILSDMKAEIHTLAMLDDTFIGCIHRQMTERHMVYNGPYATEGCIPTESFSGVLRVIVLVFNVIKDATHYRLWVQAE